MKEKRLYKLKSYAMIRSLFSERIKKINEKEKIMSY
jgi:hypothetical protein